MPRLNVSDLTYSQREALLANIRNQLGQSAFDRMVETVGEDQLLEMVLEKAPIYADSGGTSPSSGSGEMNGCMIAVAIAAAMIAILLFMTGVGGGFTGSNDPGWFSHIPSWTWYAKFLSGLVICLFACFNGYFCLEFVRTAGWNVDWVMWVWYAASITFCVMGPVLVVWGLLNVFGMAVPAAP